MSIRENFIDDGLELSLIQSRMTVAGMALAALFFAGSFSLALHAQNRTPQSASYQIEYAQIQLALALGVCLVISSIASLLMCQQLPAASPRWLGSRKLWFAASTIWLYLALSQALSAGFSEVVYGLSLTSRVGGLGAGADGAPGVVTAHVWRTAAPAEETSTDIESRGMARIAVRVCVAIAGHHFAHCQN